jgi:hypothetical protein
LEREADFGILRGLEASPSNGTDARDEKKIEN